MKLFTHKGNDFYPNKEFFLDSVMDENGVVFEINDAAAYFYAVSLKEGGVKILDALHIFNIKDVTDADKISQALICWSEDYRYALLFINNYAHAIFDFTEKQGYNRTGFPPGPSQTGWSQKDKKWDEALFKTFEF